MKRRARIYYTEAQKALMWVGFYRGYFSSVSPDHRGRSEKGSGPSKNICGGPGEVVIDDRCSVAGLQFAGGVRPLSVLPHYSPVQNEDMT